MPTNSNQTKNLEELISKILNSTSSDTKLRFEAFSPDSFLLAWDEGKLSNVFKITDEPGDDESDLASDETSPNNDQEKEDDSAKLPATFSEQVIQDAINSFQQTVDQTKLLKREAGANIEKFFESFSSSTFNFKIDKAKEEMIFKKKSSTSPLYFPMEFRSTHPHQVGENKIKTIITPYARAWKNKTDEQMYIQLMGYVQYGWNINKASCWNEPSRLTIKVSPDSCCEDCSLVSESIQAPNVFSINERIEHTKGQLREKGITADLKLDIAGSSNGGSLSTPSLIIDYKGTDHNEVKKLDTEVKKIEFESLLQGSLKEVTWTLERRYSKVANNNLDRFDLALYSETSTLSKEEFSKIKLENVYEPFGNYVNFGVWKWNGERTSFTFNVHYGFRSMKKIRSWKPFKPQYKLYEQAQSAGYLNFPVERQFR